MLTARLTAAPFAKCLPAAALCETTRPLLTVFEKTNVTKPALQCAAKRRVLAVESVWPNTFGTAQT